MNAIIVRHGETIENAKDIVMGHHGGELSKKGIQQAKDLAERLKDEDFDQAWSSDLKRCVDTARYILRYHADIELQLTPALREVNYGEYQGRPGAEIREYFDNQGGFNYKSKAPGGESHAEMSVRVLDFLNELFSKSPDQKILLVSHNGPIETIRASVERISFTGDAENASVKRFEITIPLELYPQP